MVGFSHDIFIMLDNDDGISNLRKRFKILDESAIISRMQTNRWFVKDIDDSLKPRTNLGRETNSLRFSSREGICSTRNGNVVESDI
jgi:hypothetical protein